MNFAEHLWLPRLPAAQGDKLVLFCFPHAGARWTSFRDWDDEISSAVAVVPVDYPRRRSDGTTPFATIADLAQATYLALDQYLRGPIAFLGHSLGAIVAFEVAKLMRSDRREPAGLIVSGRAAPSFTSPELPVHALPAPAFWSRVESWGGVPEAVSSDAATLGVFERSLRADLRLAEMYQPSPASRLDCPIFAIAGISDPVAPPHAMDRWRDETTGPTALEVLPGNHFFPVTHRTDFLRLVTRLLEEV